ncbi:hypothetical protein ACLPJK_25720 [Pseudomonas aeruginosa]|uniref:hypothetical protein n=1 Tax=Pseudomonas aeruginosa TaxID=287 RepID=UPI003D2A323A
MDNPPTTLEAFIAAQDPEVGRSLSLLDPGSLHAKSLMALRHAFDDVPFQHIPVYTTLYGLLSTRPMEVGDQWVIEQYPIQPCLRDTHNPVICKSGELWVMPHYQQGVSERALSVSLAQSMVYPSGDDRIHPRLCRYVIEVYLGEHHLCKGCVLGEGKHVVEGLDPFYNPIHYLSSTGLLKPLLDTRSFKHYFPTLRSTVLSSELPKVYNWSESS